MRISIFKSMGLLFLAGLSGVHALPSDWPEWRGPDGQGHAGSGAVPLTWSESRNVAWKTEIPGRAWSSPVLEGDQVWMTTAYETEADPADAEKRLKENTGDQPLTLLEEVRLHAVGVDKKTGEILKNVELIRLENPQWVHRLNSYASPTPVLKDGRLYAHFGTYGTACLDTKSGRVLWRNTHLNIMHENGPGSSTFVWGDLVILTLDGSDVQYTAALHKNTGEVVWKTDRSGKLHDNPQLQKSYGTPLVLEVQGRPLLISPGADWLYAYEPETGKEVWKLNYETLGFSISSRPVVGHGMIYMSTGFMRPNILAIRYDSASGPEIAWRHTKGAPQIPSPLLVGDELYFVTDSGGIVTCLDAHTGKEHYRERLGGNYNASPFFADGKIFFCSREGVTTVLKPGPKFEVLAKNELSGQIMATPAVVDGAIFLRSDKALYRIEQGERK